MNVAVAPNLIELSLTPTRFDGFLAGVFPKWAAQRMRAKREYAYEAAVSTRLRSNATRLQGPEDYTAFPDRLQLIRQVRDLEQNFGLFQHMMDKIVMYAFGRIRYQSRTGDKATNDAYSEYLKDCFDNCDISGRHNLESMVRIAELSRIRDGDYALKWQRNNGELKLTGIEGDRLGGIYMTSVNENYFQGVTIDTTTGIPLSWRVYYRTKANSYVDPVDVPATDIIHYYDPRRYDQYRGVTPFAPVINEARDLKELMEALRIGTKFENYHSAVQYTPGGQPLDNPADWVTGSETNANGVPTQTVDLTYGKMQIAPIGSKVEWLKSDRPAGTVQTYMENLIRLIGLALNLPYGFLYNLSGLSGPSVRMDNGQAQRPIQSMQNNAKARMLNRIKDTYLMEGFATGKIKFNPKWRNGVWGFPPWPTIDAGRDSKAGIDEWRSGLKSKDEWFDEGGKDAEEEEAVIEAETERTIGRAQAIAKKFDIPIELALTMLELKTPNGFYQARLQATDNADDQAGTTIDPKTTEPPKGGKGGFQEVKIVHEFAGAPAIPEPPAKILPEAELSRSSGERVRAILEKGRRASAVRQNFETVLARRKNNPQLSKWLKDASKSNG